MKLTYRGVSYNYTPPAVQASVTGDVGKFRGVDIRFRTIKKALVQQPTLDLVYRGVAYQTSTPEAITVADPAIAEIPASAVASAFNTEDKARLNMMNQHRLVKQRQQSMLGRLSFEAGVPTEAAQH
ncbi:MAG: DUF4278 domain-containing protein [Nodosilinea sp.]